MGADQRAEASPSDRELHFMLEITTTLGEFDQIEPTIAYVEEFLAKNNYDARVIGSFVR